MSDSEDRREFVLSALRVGSLRAKLLEAEINSIGIALKGGAINCYTAIQWINDAGAMDFIRLLPTKDDVGPILGTDFGGGDE